MGGLIPTSTPARLATSLPVHPATHPSVHPAASLLVPEPQGALDGLREAERSAASSAGGWRGSTTQTGDRQALQPLQEKWGFLKRCWRGFENSVQFGAAETLGFSGLWAWAPAAPPKGGGARESVQLRASRWRRPPKGGSFAPNMGSLPGEPVASLQSPASRPLGSLGPPPERSLPHRLRRLPRRRPRSPGHALAGSCAYLRGAGNVAWASWRCADSDTLALAGQAALPGTPIPGPRRGCGRVAARVRLSGVTDKLDAAKGAEE